MGRFTKVRITVGSPVGLHPDADPDAPRDPRRPDWRTRTSKGPASQTRRRTSGETSTRTRPTREGLADDTRPVSGPRPEVIVRSGWDS